MVRNKFQDIKVQNTRKVEIKKEEISQKIYAPRDREAYIPPSAYKILENKKNNYETKRASGPRYTLWVVALVAVIFLFFALSFLFSNATITVNPKIKTISLNQNLSAVKDPNTDKVPFDLVVLSDQESKSILLEEKDFQESAKGTVLIYNKMNSTPQALAVDTRLEGSNGKIYKTKTKATIPGMSKDGVPGKVSVEIYGSELGKEYNSAPLDFKILGFKGTPKYSKFYGRSVGEISGGMVGKARLVTEDQKAIALKDLKASLQKKLFAKAVNQIPAKGFVLFKDATFLNIDDTNISPVTADGTVTMTIKGTLYGFIFNEEKLTKKIVEYLLPDETESDIYVSNLRDLSFVLLTKDILSYADVTDIDFNIYGVPKIVYKFDSTKLVPELLGKNKEYLNSLLLAEYPNVESATYSIKPIWKSTFPDKAEKINVIINYPN